MKPRVLVICENFTTAIRVVPAYKALLERGNVKPILFTTFGEPSTLDYFKGQGVEYLTVRDVIDDMDREWLSRMRDEYEAVFNAARAKHETVTCRYRGVPMLPFIGDEALRLNQMKIFCHYVFRKLVGRFKPSLVFTGYCSGGKKKQYVTMANRMGIPTLHLQYGSNILPRGTSRRELFSANYCVWGKAFRELYVDKPEFRARTVVTGDPTFDAYADVDRESVRRRLDIAPGTRVIMIGICYEAECHEVASQLQGVNPGGESVCVFKLHPALADRKTAFERVFGEAGVSCRVVAQEISPYEILCVADHYVVLEQESLWLTAFHFGVVPTIVESFAKFTPERHPLPWVLDAGARIKALSDLPRLDEAVGLVDHDVFEKARRRLWHSADFKAGQRVSAVAEGLVFGRDMGMIRKEVEEFS